MELFEGPADHEMSVGDYEQRHPDGKTYLGFVLLWDAIILVVWMFCIVLFAAGYVAAGIFTILLTGYAHPADSWACGLGSALDGEGANSPFSAALSRHIGTPGIEVRQMLTRVRAEVVAKTSGKQVP
ncbi:hypothetical protein SAMN05444169_8482 [Bradyrhizobium erythrophlei]|jgi:hypothetical protein|uniref:Peptidase C14 caspase domain-containing protein n=1 Tax=Bradyrhizobium erythrophlei TaxID=1437360 RepID=A0A1M5UKE2_9BRAD|nr:caspase family protein [Bradyrhizobium erythrophlei]SHH63475.1 hypothetical protein SAMN05444169_8482 [Bradyrhizobium erythrophlei]